MVEPRIQYAKTEDGVNIAYWTLGQGLPVVEMPGAGHIELEWRDPDFGQWYRRQASTHRVIRYDARGTGLSDRDVGDLSLQGWVRDLAAVADCLGLERFALTGVTGSGPAAIAYAAGNSERVSHLFLWCTYWCAEDLHTPQLDALNNLAESDWELYTETIAHAMVAGWSEGDRARRFAKLVREGTTPQVFRAQQEAWSDVDVSDLLPRVHVPTYVIQRRDAPWPGLETARGLAARIPGAELQILEGSSLLPFIEDMETVAQLIEEALGLPPPAHLQETTAELAAPAALVTVLFTDMEGSTTLADQLGDAAAQEVRSAHNEIVRAALGEHDGREIKHTGDGIMASFATASSALDAAIAIQRGVAAHKEAHPDSPLGVYVGLNAGEPIAEDDDLFGTSINLAARICDHADTGQILAANVVRELAAGKQFLFADLGETELRGFEDPVKLWELRWREDG